MSQVIVVNKMFPGRRDWIFSCLMLSVITGNNETMVAGMKPYIPTVN